MSKLFSNLKSREIKGLHIFRAGFVPVYFEVAAEMIVEWRMMNSLKYYMRNSAILWSDSELNSRKTGCISLYVMVPIAEPGQMMILMIDMIRKSLSQELESVEYRSLWDVALAMVEAVQV
jgi:hypothetical protein